jgi:hypothetical protein
MEYPRFAIGLNDDDGARENTAANEMRHTRTDLKHQLEAQLRFESLLADISARFVNFPAEQVDNAIEEAQHHICEGLGFNLSTLWQWSSETPHLMMLTH